MLCDDLVEWGGVGGDVPERGDICTHMADSQCCTAETLESSYIPIVLKKHSTEIEKKRIQYILYTYICNDIYYMHTQYMHIYSPTNGD